MNATLRRPPLLLPLLLAAACFASRLAFLGRYPEGWDSINFLLALREYDLTQGQPHFPGYPVYIFAGWLLNQALTDEIAALLVAGGLFSSLALLPLYRLTFRLFGSGAALGACLLYIANPLLFLEAEKVFSDAFCLLFLLAVADFTEAAAPAAADSARPCRRAARRAGYLAGLSAGLMLGVRLSLWPVALSAAAWLALRRGERPGPSLRALLHGGIHGVGVWLIPLLLLTDPRSLVAAGAGHLRGHFTQWGGTAVTQGDILSRLAAFCWDLGPNGMGLWWPDTPPFRLLPTLLVAAAVISYVRVYRRRPASRFLLLFILPYATWVFLGQNLANPRHVLPLVALLLPLLAAGLLCLPSAGLRPVRRASLARCRRPFIGAAACGLLVAAWAMTALPLVEQNRRVPPTRVSLIAYVRDQYDPERTAVVGWNSARFFDYLAPEWADRVVGSLEEGRRLTGPDGVLLVLSDMPEFQSLRQRHPLRPVHAFSRSRYVHNYLHRLVLYELMH